MQIHETTLRGVLVVEPDLHADARGWLCETFRADRYVAAGIPAAFEQENLSSSHAGVLRGLHFQYPHPQGKFVQVLEGKVFDVVLDVRRGSPTFGRYETFTLTADRPQQLWIPPGFAHGFCAQTERALCSYRCTRTYVASAQRRVAWNDPALAIPWPVSNPRLSPEDAAARTLAEQGGLPDYEG